MFYVFFSSFFFFSICLFRLHFTLLLLPILCLLLLLLPPQNFLEKINKFLFFLKNFSNFLLVLKRADKGKYIKFLEVIVSYGCSWLFMEVQKIIIMEYYHKWYMMAHFYGLWSIPFMRTDLRLWEISKQDVLASYP